MNQGKKYYQLLAPREIQECIFQHLHTQRYAGHLGRDRTLNAIKKRFYWPAMDIDIARWVKECQMCARAKPGPGRGRNPIEQFKVFRPMSQWPLIFLVPYLRLTIKICTLQFVVATSQSGRKPLLSLIKLLLWQLTSQLLKSFSGWGFLLKFILIRGDNSPQIYFKLYVIYLGLRKQRPVHITLNLTVQQKDLIELWLVCCPPS